VRGNLPPALGRQEPSGPLRLSQTGLYRNLATRELAPGVQPFKPQFELWSDGADKQRWVLLPAGQKIDTRNMDRWRFPIGTRLWKEFAKAGKRLETRLMFKRAEPDFNDEGWDMMTFVWDDGETEATLVEGGVASARGTGHEVPRQIDCKRCHRTEFERPMGFSAIQLSGPGPGLRLRQLVEQGWLSHPPPSPDGYTVPGNATARAALGYLHANCGGCHAPDTDTFRDIDMSLHLEVGKLSAVLQTPTYLTSANKATTTPKAGGRGRIRLKPGVPAESEIINRMSIRFVDPESLQMPPLGSHQIDTAGRQVVSDWIKGLP
jgi:hypothetical protein